MSNSILEKLESVEVVKQDKLIIRQIRQLISSGELVPGDKLPPERVLAERFNVGRGYVRLAIQQLELYGILKTKPQSGTVVSELGITILDDLFSNVLTLEAPDVESLFEARIIIEVETAKLAAKRITEASLKRLEDTFARYEAKVSMGYGAIEEDILFHIRIAECADNSVLRSMIMVLAQDIISQSNALESCSGERKNKALNEHREILDALRNKNEKAAIIAMKNHLENSKN